MVDNYFTKHTGFGGDQTLERAEKGLTLEFYHVATGRAVSFKAMLNSFQDEYNSTWEEEEIYGRMDPIQTFKSTVRTITASWEVVASHIIEARHNMDKMSEFAALMYPVYERGGIKAGPMLRMQFGNFVTKAESKDVGPVETTGLLGTCSGFSFEPDMEDVLFSDGSKQMFPKIIKLSINFKVIHEVPLGFNGKEKRTPSFPYGSKAGLDSKMGDQALRDMKAKEVDYSDPALNDLFKGLEKIGSGTDQKTTTGTSEAGAIDEQIFGGEVV